MPEYVTNVVVHHAGSVAERGARVHMTAKQAAPYLECGLIRKPTEPAPNYGPVSDEAARNDDLAAQLAPAVPGPVTPVPVSPDEVPPVEGEAAF